MLSKNTRIGILAPIVWSIPPKGYGPWENVVANLVQGIRDLGYMDITLFATKETQIPGIKTVALYDRPLEEGKYNHPKELLHVAHSLNQASELGIEILHNHCNYFPLLFNDVLPFPIITTLHGSAAEPESNIAYTQYKHLPYVSISEAERNISPTLHYVRTIYNPINFELFSLNEKPKKYLVNVGRMHPDKGVHQAIALAKAVGMPLFLAGPISADCQKYFDTKIAPYVDGVHVVYVGNLPMLEAKKLVAEAFAFVGLINYAESFGLAIAEAMASGTPVIGMARGSHKELIRNGVTGILVSSIEEAIARFDELKLIDRAQCRLAIQQMCDTPNVAAEYLQAYEYVLNKR